MCPYLSQKFTEGKQAFAKAVFRNEEEKEKWSKALKMELMSSEESDIEDEKEVLIHHPIPWLSSTVQTFKKKLDEEIIKGKSPQAKRQRKDRVLGRPPTRPLPTDSENFPTWIFIK